MWPKWRSKKAFPRWCSSSARNWRKNWQPKGQCADLVLGNNVLAQVPDLNDFVEGLKILLKPARSADAGISPSAAADRTQRVRHDLSRALFVFFAAHHGAHHGSSRAEGLRCGRVDVPTAARCVSTPAGRRMQTHAIEPSVRSVIAEEKQAGLASLAGYESFAQQVKADQVGAAWNFC